MISRAEIKSYVELEPKFDDIMCSLKATGRQPKGIIKETRKLIAMARKFNEEVTRPAALVLDRRIHEDHDYLPWEYVHEANKRGFYTLFIPEIFGGQGYSLTGIGYFLEELASVCLAMANIIGVHYLGLSKLISSWNMKVIDRLCRAVTEGEQTDNPCLLSVAMTEPDAGTDSQNVEFMDVGNLGCHAKKVSGGYVINGTKIFISMGHLSTWHLVHAYTDLEKSSENTVMLAVETGTKGFSFGKIENKMGQKGSVASELIFNDCFIPDEDVCIDNRQIAGLSRNSRATNGQIFASIWSASRMGVASLGTGVSRGAFETALEFASENKVDGQLLVNHEWCQARLAEMYKNTAAARTAYSESCYANGMHGLWKMLNFKPLYYFQKCLPSVVISIFGRYMNKTALMTKIFRMINFNIQKDEELARIDGWGSLAKFSCTDAGIANCRMALEIMGQAGIRHDRRAEKMLRDSKLLQIYEGTNQINRINLFKNLVARSCPDVETMSVLNY